MNDIASFCYTPLANGLQPLRGLHTVLPQVIDVVASLIEELQVESLLVGVELLVRSHIRQLSDS